MSALEFRVSVVVAIATATVLFALVAKAAGIAALLGALLGVEIAKHEIRE